MRVFRVVGAAIMVAACGGGSSGGGGPTGQTPVASVTVVPSATTTSICGTLTFTATPRDANQQPLSRSVDSWSGGGTVLSLSTTTGANVTATGIGVGTANISATSGGQTSTPVAIAVTASGAAPTTSDVAATANETFSPACVEIASGGTVTWTFAGSHNVIFEVDPPGGDVPQQTGGTASRTFNTVREYKYTCTLHAGMNGRVVVR